MEAGSLHCWIRPRKCAVGVPTFPWGIMDGGCNSGKLPRSLLVKVSRSAGILFFCSRVWNWFSDKDSAMETAHRMYYRQLPSGRVSFLTGNHKHFTFEKQHSTEHEADTQSNINLSTCGNKATSGKRQLNWIEKSVHSMAIGQLSEQGWLYARLAIAIK